MKPLTTKERAGVNAALAIIHSRGHDVAPVQQQARAAMSRGAGILTAYQQAVGAFAKAHPDIAPVLTRIDRLIDASDSRTVERYDKALAAYIETGDQAHVNALEGMVRSDMVALAVHDGELSAEDAAAGRVAWEGMGLAEPAPSSAPQQFAFNVAGGPKTAAPASPAPAPTVAGSPASPASQTRQVALPGANAGTRTTMPISERTARHRAAPVPGMGRESPYAGMAPAQIKEAMRADFAGPRGWVDRPADAPA